MRKLGEENLTDKLKSIETMMNVEKFIEDRALEKKKKEDEDKKSKEDRKASEEKTLKEKEDKAKATKKADEEA